MFFRLLPWFLGSSAFADTSSLTFTIQPGSTGTAAIAASTGGSSSQTITYSGSFTADVTYTSLTPNEITFTGGAITISDTNLSLNTNILINGTGPHATSISLATSNLTSSPTTPTPPGDLTALPHTLTNSQHQITLNQGTSTAGISVPAFDLNESEVTNYDASPESDPLSGENTIAITESNLSLFSRDLTFTLISTVNESTSDSIDGSNLTLTSTEQGSYTATAALTVPSPYGQWALDNSLTNPQLDDLNPSGIPYGLLFAFRLPATSASLPFKAISTAAGPKISITLPAAGLAMTLVPEHSPDLSSPFTSLPLTLFDDGAGSLNEGKTTSTTLSFPSLGSRGFIRFKTSL